MMVMFKKSSDMRKGRDDTGNTMIIAMAVLMIMGILAAAVWAKTISGLNLSGYDRTHLSVMAVANSGIDEAIFRLEQISPDESGITDTLTGSGNMSGGSFSYTATRKNDLSWEIVSVAVIGGSDSPYTIRRAIKADARTTSRFDVAVGGRTSVRFSGIPLDAGQACSYDSRDTGSDVYCADGSRDGPLTAALMGTSGSLDCDGNAQSWGQIPIVLWPPSGSATGACQTTVPPPPAPYPWEPVEAPNPSGSNAIQDNAAGDCYLTGADVASMGAGVYNCRNLVLGSGGNQAMCTNNSVDMWNPIEIYVSGNLEFERGAWLNVGDLPNGGCAPRPAAGPEIDGLYPTEMAGAFRVYKASSSEIVTPGGANKPVMSMVLYAPYSTFQLNGGPQVYIFGSVMVDQFDTNGAVNVLAYDRSLSLITTKKYYIQNWREIPPAEAN